MDRIMERLINGEWLAYKIAQGGGIAPPPPPPPFPPQQQPVQIDDEWFRRQREYTMQRMRQMQMEQQWLHERQQDGERRQPGPEPLPDSDVSFGDPSPPATPKRNAGRALFSQMTKWRSRKADSDEEGSSSPPEAASDAEEFQPPPLLDRNIQLRAPTPQRHQKPRETEPLTPQAPRQHPPMQPSPSPPKGWHYNLQGARPKETPSPPVMQRHLPGRKAIKKLYSKYKE